MSFSWWCKDKNGKDLFKEFGVHSQALGLGPHCDGDTEAPYHVSALRSAWCGVRYKDIAREAARDALSSVQSMVTSNLLSLKPKHCATCTCGTETPKGWTVEACESLLRIPLDRVWRAGGGH